MNDDLYINYFESEMLRVEGGEFDMGGTDAKAERREKSVHRVRLHTFYLGRYPVTQALWNAVLGEENNQSAFKGPQRPVDYVTWGDIVNHFLPELNRLTKLSRPPGSVYRLPTEAEWEYAARGGPHQSPYRYAGSNKLKAVGWFNKNSHNDTKPVGLKDPNELGLYDMSGNVWEWCADWYDGDYYETCKRHGVVENPLGPDKGVYRVLRGGSYYFNAQYCRVSYCHINRPDDRFIAFGFRLALSLQSTG